MCVRGCTKGWSKRAEAAFALLSPLPPLTCPANKYGISPFRYVLLEPARSSGLANDGCLNWFGIFASLALSITSLRLFALPSLYLINNSL